MIHPHQEAHYAAMGFKLHLISNSGQIIAAAQTSFGRFGPAEAQWPPDFVFRLFEHDIDDGPPQPPVFRMEGALLYQSTGRDSTLVVDLTNSLAFGYFSASVLANEAFFRWHFLEFAFFMMLEAQGLMGVHGSALVKNGRAILLRAQSGGGKTTLAYAGARDRFQALAEDVVWLDQKRQVWWGRPWSFHLLPDAKRLFPELASYEPRLQTNGELKLEVNLEDIRPNSTTISAQPGAIVLIERRPGGQSRLEPVDPATIRSAWNAGRTGLEMKLPHHAQYIDDLLTLPTYRLDFGDDIDQALALFDPIFSS